MTASHLFATAAAVALAGVGLFEARVVAHQRTEIDRRQTASAGARRQLADFKTEQLKFETEAAALEKELAGQPEPDAAAGFRQSEISHWLGRVKHLQQLFSDRPDQRIPEMALLTEEDWLRAAQRAAFDDEHQTRKAFADLRTRAKNRFHRQLSTALSAFSATGSGDATPASMAALAGYFTASVDLQILARYEVTTDAMPGYPGRRGAVVREKVAVDEDYDSRMQVSSQSMMSVGGPYAWPIDFTDQARRAHSAYVQANSGQRPKDVLDTLPYFDPPLNPAKVAALRRFEADRERSR